CSSSALCRIRSAEATTALRLGRPVHQSPQTGTSKPTDRGPRAQSCSVHIGWTSALEKSAWFRSLKAVRRLIYSSHSHGKTISFHSSGPSSEVISLQAAPSLSSYPPIPWRILLPILIVALSLRIAWVITQTNVIENEGAEYLRIAQSLRSGVGYSGMMSGPELL